MKVKIHEDEESRIIYVPFSVTFDDREDIIDGVIIKSFSCVGGMPMEDIDIELDDDYEGLTDLELEELRNHVIDAYYKAISKFKR